jgi:hypothetical protein
VKQGQPLIVQVSQQEVVCSLLEKRVEWLSGKMREELLLGLTAFD